MAFDGDTQTFTVLGPDGQPRKRPSDRRHRPRETVPAGQITLETDRGGIDEIFPEEGQHGDR